MKTPRFTIQNRPPQNTVKHDTWEAGPDPARDPANLPKTLVLCQDEGNLGYGLTWFLLYSTALLLVVRNAPRMRRLQRELWTVGGGALGNVPGEAPPPLYKRSPPPLCTFLGRGISNGRIQ